MNKRIISTILVLTMVLNITLPHVNVYAEEINSTSQSMIENQLKNDLGEEKANEIMHSSSEHVEYYSSADSQNNNNGGDDLDCSDENGNKDKDNSGIVEPEGSDNNISEYKEEPEDDKEPSDGEGQDGDNSGESQNTDTSSIEQASNNDNGGIISSTEEKSSDENNDDESSSNDSSVEATSTAESITIESITTVQNLKSSNDITTITIREMTSTKSEIVEEEIIDINKKVATDSDMENTNIVSTSSIIIDSDEIDISILSNAIFGEEDYYKLSYDFYSINEYNRSLITKIIIQKGGDLPRDS